jgi:hypothetical protein
MGLQDRLDALQPRERRLLALFVGLFAVISVLLIPIGVSAMLAERRGENEQLREAIDRLFAERDDLLERQMKNQTVLNRYKTSAPALAGFLDKHAKALELEIPEFKDKPPVPIGKEYEERSTEITLKRTPMKKFVQFMEKIAQAPFPISVTRLNVRKRGTEPDSWDASLTVSAYHRLAPVKKAAAEAQDEASVDSEEEGEEEE